MALTKRQTGQPKIQVFLRPAKSPRLEGKTIKGIIGSLNVWSSKECVCCACDPNAHSICFVCVFCMSKVISSFRSLRAGSQVFALLMLFL